MKRLSTGPLSPIEKEILAEIRRMRAAPRGTLASSLLDNPPRLVRHFLLVSHGNVRLRISVLAREIGVEIRTLERSFVIEFRGTMAQCQVEVRTAFSQWLLSTFPPTKISVIASLLGYERVQDFNRFFKKRMHESPSEWGRKARERLISHDRRITGQE